MSTFKPSRPKAQGHAWRPKTMAHGRGSTSRPSPRPRRRCPLRGDLGSGLGGVLRRREVRLFAALLLLAGCRRKAPSAPPAPDVVLFFASGLAGEVASPKAGPGGLARRATLVDRARVTARAVVQVDAGDLLAGEAPGGGPLEPEARAQRARLVLQSYRRMGVDAVTLGESDLSLGADAWRTLAATEKVPIVAANVFRSDGQALFPAYRVIETPAVKLGVFGVLEPAPTFQGLSTDMVLKDALVAAKAAEAALRRQGAQIVIGLLHVAGGLARAKALAAEVPGVDVFVLGHPGPAEPPRFLSTEGRGADLGRVDLRAPAAGAVVLATERLVVGPDLPDQYGVLLLQRASAPIAATFAESVAALSKAMGRRTFGEEWKYGTTALCQSCHPNQHTQWGGTDHAHAFASLTGGHERDPQCMGCHMTGFLSPGGVQNLESASQFVDVGCECCHGPSVMHVTSADKHKGTSRAVDPVLCFGCHTPDQNRGPFVLADAMREIVGPGHGQPADAAKAGAPR